MFNFGMFFIAENTIPIPNATNQIFQNAILVLKPIEMNNSPNVNGILNNKPITNVPIKNPIMYCIVFIVVRAYKVYKRYAIANAAIM